MTHTLTEKEIEDLLECIVPSKCIPPKTALSIMKNHKDRARKMLIGKKVYPAIIPELKKDIMKHYTQTLIHAGESVGVICGQSIGEKQTQSTLNTFHRAGQSDKTVIKGVPKIGEMLNATRNPSSSTSEIRFKNHPGTIQELRKTVGHSLVGLTLKKISIDMIICIDKEKEPWYDVFRILYEDEDWYSDFTEYKHCISLKIDIKMLFIHKLTLQDIVKTIHEDYSDLFCVFSPCENSRIDIFVNTIDITLPEDRLLFINHDNVIEIYLEESVLPILKNMLVAGIKDIEQIYYTRDRVLGEWYIETEGNNFNEIMCIPEVDTARTTSDNVWDVYAHLGIEAAREFLINEFISIMEGINICHVMLLVERMTFAGTISSITRYTMRKESSGVISKAAFEETTDNMLKAAANGETDPTEGVSASIICGKRAKIGTGMMDLKIDINALPKFVSDIKDEE
jgi:DNA-directed RNA polymerase beta' subunit